MNGAVIQDSGFHGTREIPLSAAYKTIGGTESAGMNQVNQLQAQRQRQIDGRNSFLGKVFDYVRALRDLWKDLP